MGPNNSPNCATFPITLHVPIYQLKDSFSACWKNEFGENCENRCSDGCKSVRGRALDCYTDTRQCIDGCVLYHRDLPWYFGNKCDVVVRKCNYLVLNG